MKKTLFGILILLLLFVGYFFIGSVEPAKDIVWGVNFSQSHAKYLGLDWKESYSAMLDDLGAKKIKIATQWDLIEKESGEYYFEDLDWQVKMAQEKGAQIFLVVGLKTGRWPECRIPDWAKLLEVENQQKKTLELIENIVLRYRESGFIKYWQVENEPFFPFGECPWADKTFLKKEINLVKSLDPERLVIISDSGEFSFWIQAARFGDVVSTTLHRRVWFKEVKTYITYPLKPVFYWRKSQIINKFFGKEVFVGELQAEPWCSLGIGGCELKEQEKTMDLEYFKNNIEFAKNTGLSQHYLWGVEWMYWMKEKQDDPSIWNEARKLFK